MDKPIPENRSTSIPKPGSWIPKPEKPANITPIKKPKYTPPEHLTDRPFKDNSALQELRSRNAHPSNPARVSRRNNKSSK